eukprot:888202-Pelagomonas_calceolata.AAC.2
MPHGHCTGWLWMQHRCHQNGADSHWRLAGADFSGKGDTLAQDVPFVLDPALVDGNRFRWCS